MEATAKLNLIDVICSISAKLEKSQLEDKNLKSEAKNIAQLSNYLNLSREEALLFVVIYVKNYERERKIDISDMASFLDVGILKMLQKYQLLKELVHKKILTIEKDRRDRIPLISDRFMVHKDIMQTILENKPLSKLSVSDSSESPLELGVEFFDEITQVIETQNFDMDKMIKELKAVEKSYKDTELVQKCRDSIENSKDRLLFYKICSDLDVLY